MALLSLNVQFFFFPVSFLNLSAPFSHSNPSSLLYSLSPIKLSAFQLLSAIQPSALWHLHNHHSLLSGQYLKNLVGGGGQEGHAGEEFKFSYQKRPDFFFPCFVNYLLTDGRCPWLLHGKLILTNANLTPDLSKSGMSAFLLLPLYWKQVLLFIFLSSPCHLCMRAFQSD